jgi:hypothetical protein
MELELDGQQGFNQQAGAAQHHAEPVALGGSAALLFSEAHAKTGAERGTEGHQAELRDWPGRYEQF